MAGNFVDDPNATLPGPKRDLRSIPAGADRNQYLDADGYNALRQALLDVKGAVGPGSQWQVATAQVAADKAAAEAARDQAEGVTGIYDTPALGLVATPDGGYFKVPDGAGGLITYRDTAGVAVEVGRVASGAEVKELVASVPPRSNDSAGNLIYWVDVAGRVTGILDANSEQVLVGRSETVQARLASLDGITEQETTAGSLFQVDVAGNVTEYVDPEGERRVADLSESVQATLRRVEETANLLYRPTGGVVIPTTFTPMTKALRPEERFVWSGMPAHLRPAPTSRVVTAYPFSWEDTGVIALPADMKRRRGVINPPGSFDPVTWTHLEDLTVNAPPGFFDPVDPYYTRSWRDASIMYDRKLGKYWWADSGIGRTADGWPQLNVPIFESTDGLTFDFVGYTPNVSGPSDFGKKMISPDWFIDSDGGVYLIVDGYHTGAGPRTYIILKCTTPDTMLTWEEVGDITGTALPTSTASGGQVDIIDPYIFQRHGVYYVIWKAERAGTEDATQLGIAWSDSILGPYNNGHRFLDPYGNKIKGQGMSVTELPPGGPYRFRLWFDKYGPDVYPGMTSAAQQACTDTNDFTTFSPVRGVNIHPTIRQHTTYVIGF